MRNRTDKFESKLAINGSYDDVKKDRVTPGNPAPKPKPAKPPKKK